MPTLTPFLADAWQRDVAPLMGAGADTLREAIASAAPGATPWRAATAAALASGQPADLFAILFATRCLVPGEHQSVNVSHRALLQASDGREGVRALLQAWFKTAAFGKGKGRVFLLAPTELAALAELATRHGVPAADWAEVNKQLEHADLPEDSLLAVLALARSHALRAGVGLAWILDEDLEPARRALEDRSADFSSIAGVLAAAGLPPWSALTWVYAVTNVTGARFFAEADNSYTIDPIHFAAVWYGPRPRGGLSHVAYTSREGAVFHQTPPPPKLWARLTDDPDPMARYVPFSEGPCARAGCRICAAALKVAATLEPRP